MKRFLSVLLVTLLLFGGVQLNTRAASTEAEVKAKIEAMARGDYGKEYKVGNYWNKMVTSPCASDGNYGHKGKDPNPETDKYGYAVINGDSSSGVQCLGFALEVFDELFGGGKGNNIECEKIVYSRSGSKKNWIINNAKVGDLINIKDSDDANGHWGIFYKYDSNYLYFYDANGYTNAGTCKISLTDKRPWARLKLADGTPATIYRAKNYTLGGVNKLTIKYNVNGGSVSSDTYGITGDGLIKTLSDGSTNIQVEKYGEYEKWGLYDYDTFGLYKNGYKFGGWILSNNTSKVYDMAEPWYPENIYPNLSKGSATITATAVWNPMLTIKYNANGGKISSDKAGTYYLASSGIVKFKSRDGEYTQSQEYGKTIDNGFVDDITLGLVRDGYTFEGWSLAKSGSRVYTDTEKWKPEEVYPALKNGPATVTAYAIWKQKEHTFGAWQTTKGATCTATGQQIRTCSECSATESRSISAKGHSYSSSFTTDKSATCTAAGSKSRHCTVCSAKTDVTTITAKGHSYGEWKTIKQPTTSKEGQAVRECTQSGCTESETKTIAKLSKDGHTHKYGEWKTTRKATCTKDGLKQRSCTVCGEAETTAISMTGHNFGDWYIAKSATQNENGIRQRKCSGCGKIEEQTIEKLAQNVEQQIPVSSATEDSSSLSSDYINVESEPQVSSEPDESYDTVSLKQESDVFNVSSEYEGVSSVASPLWLIILVFVLSAAVIGAGVVIIVLVKKTKK